MSNEPRSLYNSEVYWVITVALLYKEDDECSEMIISLTGIDDK